MIYIKKYIIYASIAAISIAMIFYSYLNPIVYNITPIESFNQATKTFDAIDTESLVVFDVDDTLIIPGEKIYWSKNIINNHEFLKKITNEALKKGTKPKEYYMSLWKAQDHPMLIEPSIANIIRSLQAKGIKVIALTALNSGSGAAIASLPEWRYEKLKSVGIDFSTSQIPDVIFAQFTDDKGQHPIFYKGILLSARFSKGEILGALLDQLNWKPKQVIYFEDSLDRLKEVAQAMHKRSIPFIGFQYLGENLLPGDLDKNLAEFQLNYLVEHEKWLSEAQARAMMDREMRATAISPA